jgi:hypothetical protein
MTTLPTARTLARALTGVALAATLTACKGLTSIDASFQNVTASDTVYALNGGPPGAANSLKFFDGLVLRANQGFAFDIAFDLDEAGNIVIIPVKAVATTFPNDAYSVALQRMTGTFQSVLEAPKDGYRPDTAMTIGVGQTIIAESRDVFGVCAFSLKGQSYYSKLVVNEVDPLLKRIVFTVTVNRNCGFRSFAPGIPED